MHGKKIVKGWDEDEEQAFAMMRGHHKDKNHSQEYRLGKEVLVKWLHTTDQTLVGL